MKELFLFVFILSIMEGVFNGETQEPKSVDVTLSVMEGETKTLKSGFTEIIISNDLILWMFEETCIAQMNKETGKMSLSDEGIFQDKLHLDTQNGDLTIRNSRNKNAGVYQLKIINSEVLSKTFTVIVNENGLDVGHKALLIFALVGIIAAGVVVICSNIKKFPLKRRHRF